MKILMLSNCQTVENQGSGYVIVNTARCLEQQGHIVTLIPPESISLFAFLKSTAVIYRMLLGMAWWTIVNRVKKYDLIIFYGAESFLSVYIIKKILKIKTPIILHSNGIELLVSHNLKSNFSLVDKKKKWYHFDLSNFFMYCYKAVDCVITVSKSESDFLIDVLKANPEKVFFNNLALPNIYFDNKFVVEKKKIITFCGRWTSHKGKIAMEKAIPAILIKYPDYKFRLIGVGNDFNVNEFFKEDIINQIEVFPFVENKRELLDLYLESSIFLFPSLTESFGLVIAEAMYCGCAVISGPTGFAAELKDNIEAIILQKPDLENIINSLELLINDESLRKSIAQNAKLKVESLTWTNYNIKLKSIIDNINILQHRKH
jgi:glycosyltransferase involved in cell wall biosynthesis